MNVLKILPNQEGIKSFDKFQNLVNITNFSSGLDYVTLTSDNQTQFPKDMWMDAMSENRNEDSIATFKE